MKKWLAIGIILLFAGTCIIPALAQNTEKPQSASRGNWLYVGGSGPGNYTKIQNAIDNASGGDTIFVYDDSSPYIENIQINKSLTLVGEEKNSTKIEAENLSLDIVKITTSNVAINNFTVQLSNATCILILNSDVQITDIVIADCIVRDTRHGVDAENSTLNIKRSIVEKNIRGILFKSGSGSIVENIVKNNTFGIWFISSSGHIEQNIVQYNGWAGITVTYSKENLIIGNNDIRSNDVYGIWIVYVSGITIVNNNIQGNLYGIFSHTSRFLVVKENNFIGNFYQANFYDIFFNYWTRNYWDDWDGTGPKAIPGKIYVDNLFAFPWNNYDWRPAHQPYDLPGMR